VRPYPGPGAALQVSTSGGDEPLWARRGLELFFRQGDALMSVDLVNAGGRLTAGTAKKLFSGRYATGGVRTGYDVSLDGRSFLLVKLSQPRETLSQFALTLNWFEAMKQRVATGR
jgi:hypothetical protein